MLGLPEQLVSTSSSGWKTFPLPLYFFIFHFQSFLSSLNSLTLSFKQMFSLVSHLMSMNRAPQDLLHLITRNIAFFRTEGFFCLPLFTTFTTKNEIAKG